MLRSSFFLLASVIASLSAVACGSGSATRTGSGEAGTSASATDPADDPDGGKKDGSTNGGASLGPSCTAYVACCEELAASQPQLAASCDAVQKQIDTAQASGVSTASYESACKSGVTSFQSAGYCK